jgi:hypothetical protein
VVLSPEIAVIADIGKIKSYTYHGGTENKIANPVIGKLKIAKRAERLSGR